jgi:hypothetical protein
LLVLVVVLVVQPMHVRLQQAQLLYLNQMMFTSQLQSVVRSVATAIRLRSAGAMCLPQ